MMLLMIMKVKVIISIHRIIHITYYSTTIITDAHDDDDDDDDDDNILNLSQFGGSFPPTLS